MSTLSENLKRIRKEKGLSQTELGKRIEMSPQAIHYYETGKREPNYETLRHLAGVLSVSIADLVMDKADEFEDQNRQLENDNDDLTEENQQLYDENQDLKDKLEDRENRLAGIWKQAQDLISDLVDERPYDGIQWVYDDLDEIMERADYD
ncbi:XRE family transcriptional regulator [Lactobacillus xujianguonis]|uniref:XRE family transcriptional regulator n=2 Tax=Lactobacillaceae TaxID=33958 RepID=A0A437SSB4_9LACO|nr:helix-turn-helix transcriptional regulator [Lactobacillus xujianguonis]RVU69825.1 XRE family transcriptional regulator [Lactobacillus xujianguonis]RVU71877.1 XRE family transcriptional regulator [Lactobacillus xujianguonis]